MIFFAACCAALSLCCGSSLYVPTTSDASSSMPLKELVEGRRLYVSACGSCHTLHLPSEFSEEVWKDNLNKMWPRTRLPEGEKSLILQYLIAGSRRKGG